MSALSLSGLIAASAERLKQAGVAFGHGTLNAFDEAVWLVLWRLGLPLDTDLDEVAEQTVTPEQQVVCAALIEERIATRKLNDALLPIIEHTPPPANKGKYIKIKYITQMPLAYPAFAFFCNLPQYIKDPYKRFIENQMREKFDFNGVPITIFFRKK